ncbi:MAG TPA: S-layer protein [Gammaproteobacteria bacterium]|nr:S-layer protein [Gammaproteobacteria bacterium]
MCLVSPDDIIGWDLGGAHLKAAHLDAQGYVLAAVQLPCPLWQGIYFLQRSVDEVLNRWGANPGRHAVTMTGELVDLFSSRSEGVHALVRVMEDRLWPAPVDLFAGTRGFLPATASRNAAESIASSNWLASASFVSRHLPQALLVDIGSTTTDIVAVGGGSVLAQGMNDHARMRCGELVYSGVVRTPVMVMAQRVPFNGVWVPLMAEHFAVSADVYRLTGELPAHADQHPAADNGPKTRKGSARRLARMLGLDLEAATLADWCRLARYLSDQQMQALLANIDLVLSHHDLDADAPLVGAGVGRFLVRRLAQCCGRPYIDLLSLLKAERLATGDPVDCAPAVAVAWLARCA